MKRLIYLCSMAALVSCSPSEETVSVVKESHTVVVDETTRDTVITIEVPVYVKERETRDTVSELSCPFAWSRAEVSGGRLSHSLGTHGELPASVRIEEKIITIRDSIPYPVEVEVIREVREPLREWQRWLMWIGVAAIVVVFVAAYRRIRSPIL